MWVAGIEAITPEQLSPASQTQQQRLERKAEQPELELAFQYGIQASRWAALSSYSTPPSPIFHNISNLLLKYMFMIKIL